MFLLRVSRGKIFLKKETSSNLLRIVSSFRYYHSCTSDEKSLLKFSSVSSLKHKSSINYVLRHSYIDASNLGSLWDEIKKEDSEFAKDAKSLTNTTNSHYSEHPEAANRSVKEIQEFYKLNNIRVKGINIPKPILKFSELCLPENLMKVLERENYSEPTPIQSLGWPVAFSCRDMVGVSQTGSGKTLAYMLPAIVNASNLSSGERSRKFSVPKPKVLVLGPTRELVQQIHRVSQSYLKASRLTGACAYGGAARSVQLRNLQGAEICIATPGRLLDFIENRELSLKECSYLVLDEADRMLDMGFEPQIRDIVNQISGDRQTLMWSATWPKEIRSLAEEFLSDYIHITIGSADLVANPNIQQHIYVMEENEKDDRLLSFLKNVLENEECKVLVFAQTKRKVDYISELMRHERIPAWGIHGDCSQRQRDTVIHRFRNTTPSVLIATDVASRGLDISDINHIVNYDFPPNIEDYIHRIGRTARGSACGEAHSFFTMENTNVLKDLISVLKQSNQPVNPELYKIETVDAPKFTYKPQRRPNYQRSYNNRNRMYNQRMY